MKIKHSISSLAMLAASTSAYSLIAPPQPIPLNAEEEVVPAGIPPMPEPRTICLTQWEDEQGNAYLGDCDESRFNSFVGATIRENGCADNQAALVTYSIDIPMCPTFVQL